MSRERDDPEREEVLCFPAAVLQQYRGQALAFTDATLWARIVGALTVQPRHRLEPDPAFKQLIAYGLVRCGALYLTYLRTRRTAEQRLRAKASLGVGGHVRPSATGADARFTPSDLMTHLQTEVRREIGEEVELGAPLTSPPALRCFVTDDSDAVGQVHFGTVWECEIAAPVAHLKGEPGLGRLQFLDLPALQARANEFENWSRLLIGFLIDG